MSHYITIPIKESTASKIRRIYDDNIVSYLKIMLLIFAIICFACLFTAIGAVIGTLVVISMKISTTPSPFFTMADMIIIMGVASTNVIGFGLINYEAGYIKLQYTPDEVPKKESNFKLKPL